MHTTLLRELLDAFTRIPYVREGKDSVTDPWRQIAKADLFHLISYGAIRNPAAVYVVRWNLLAKNLEGDWERGVPLLYLSDKEETVAGLLQYLHVTQKLPKVTELIYRQFPSKTILRIQHNQPLLNVEILPRRDGDIGKLIISIPNNVLSTEICLASELLTKWYTETVGAAKPMPPPLETFKWIESISESDQNGPTLADPSGPAFLNANVMHPLRARLRDAFAAINEYRPGWSDLGDGQWIDEFATSCALTALAKVPFVVHLPSIDTIESDWDRSDSGEKGPVEGPRKELSSGGLIVFGDDAAVVDDELVTTLISLRNRHLFIGEQKALSREKSLIQARKTARAALMSRGLSHNVGSHALAHPNLLGLDYDKTVRTLKSAGDAMKVYQHEISEVHRMLQRRLDFQARVIERETDIPEPLFLIKDVLEPFFRQKRLLNSLLADTGYPGDKIEFHISLPNGAGRKELVFRWDESGKHGYYCSNDAHDLLVGLAGGSTGATALYGFLENLMRNAAKHEGSGGIMKVHLDIRHPETELRYAQQNSLAAAYVLYLWIELENPKGFNLAAIRLFLNQDLLDRDTSKLCTKGLGVLEMRLYAEYLANGISFPPDTGQHPIVRVSEVRDGSYTRLTYRFPIPKPRLLAVLRDRDLGESGSADSCAPDWWREFRNLDELESAPHHFVIKIPRTGDEDPREFLEQIAERTQRLPFRMIVLCRDETIAHRWIAQIEVAHRNGGIAARRLYVLTDDILYQHITSTTEPEVTFCGATGWEAVLLRVYDAWLRLYKPPPTIQSNEPECVADKWIVAVGFQHPKQVIAPNWQRLTKFDASSLGAFIFAEEDGRAVLVSQSGNLDCNSVLQPLIGPGSRYVLCDDHGWCFNDLAVNKSLTELPACYLLFGAKHCLEFDQEMQAPPTEAFGFAYFLFQVVEGLLTRVLIVDERIAQATLSPTGNPLAGDHYFALLRAGVFIPYRARTPAGMVAHSEVLTNAFKEYSKNETNQEGINIETGGVRVFEETDDSRKDAELPDVDVCIIHDSLAKAWNDRANAATMRLSPSWETLAKRFPRVIRCSGSGAASRQLPEEWPFMEFSALSSSVMPGSFNKAAIGSTALNLTGIKGSQSKHRGAKNW